MQRRNSLIALSAGACALSTVSIAEPQNRVWRVGVLLPRSRPLVMADHFFGAFPKGMSELGYVEGKNLVIEWRFSDGKKERLPELAAELVRLKVDVIVAGTYYAIRAAQQATATIPIVMASVGDPVGTGIVSSLARPGGNATGIAFFADQIISKHVEILKVMVPRLTRVAVLVYPIDTGLSAVLKNALLAASALGLKMFTVPAISMAEIESSFDLMKQERVDGVIVQAAGVFGLNRKPIAELALRHRLPGVFGEREYAEAGGLLSYGQRLSENFRRSATYVDKIFKGAHPGDLPIEQPMRFELVVNRKTANALGMVIPQELLLRADEVIG